MQRVIMTGGTGFIGGYVLRKLLEEQADVTVLKLESEQPDPELASERLHWINGNMECAQEAARQLAGPYDCCFHLAWAGVAPEAKNDVGLQMKNITSAMEVMKMAHAAGCRRFLMAGTVAEYVRCEGAMDVSMRQCPSDFYGAAKCSAYYFARVLAEQLGMELIWVIIPSTYGPGRKDNNLLNYTIQTLLKGEKPSFGALEQMWDFLYVEEVAKGIVCAGMKGKAGKVYGIGSGIYKPLKEFVQIVRDLIDPSLPLGIGERPQMSAITYSSCVDNRDLCADTGFVPEEDFKTRMKETIAWYRERIGR